MERQRQQLEASMILAITLDRTLLDGIDPDAFIGLAGDALKEIQQSVDGNSIGTANLDKLLLSQFGVARRTGEKVRDAVIRTLGVGAESRRLHGEYMRKRMELAKR